MEAITTTYETLGLNSIEIGLYKSEDKKKIFLLVKITESNGKQKFQRWDISYKRNYKNRNFIAYYKKLIYENYLSVVKN